MLGEGVFMGLHSSIINRTSIGEWSIIGAGATVVSDIPSNSLAVGVPARVVKRVRSEGEEYWLRVSRLLTPHTSHLTKN
jgi:acetyltransferase EpsM